MKKICAILSITIAVFIMSCSKSEKQQPKTISADNTKQNLETVNQVLNQKDRDKIETFLKRQNLKATFYEAGYWISTIEKGNKHRVFDGAIVTLTGTIQTLDGTLCYKYDTENPLEFVVGKTAEISGLHNALMQMHEGERAVLVFPPHMALGLIGDTEKIPPRSTLVYDIKITEVK